jgi:predicted transposase YbfD/YdcC
LDVAQTPSLSFLDHFSQIDDPRVNRRRRHKLLDILFIALCATIAGADDFLAIEVWGRSRRDWLQQYLELPNGIPSHDTFNRVFQALDPQQFLLCFRHWVQPLCESLGVKLIAIDGKTARATLDRKKQKNPLHVVSAWASEAHLLLGQMAVDEKSNEITAVPRLLELLDLHGAIVTLDALCCQKEIAAKIREQGGHYVLAVKGNQEHLEEDVMAAFEAEEAKVDNHISSMTTHDKGHGRIETRVVETMPVPALVRNQELWKDLKSLARVTRTYHEKGDEKSEVRYFISSAASKPKLIGQAVRGHWGVENGLHWTLDMYFGEDRQRARAGNAAENMALLRRWVLSLLRPDTTVKGSVPKKRYKATLDVEILEKILNFDQ